MKFEDDSQETKHLIKCENDLQETNLSIKSEDDQETNHSVKSEDEEERVIEVEDEEEPDSLFKSEDEQEIEHLIESDDEQETDHSVKSEEEKKISFSIKLEEQQTTHLIKLEDSQKIEHSIKSEESQKKERVIEESQVIDHFGESQVIDHSEESQVIEYSIEESQELDRLIEESLEIDYLIEDPEGINHLIEDWHDTNHSFKFKPWHETSNHLVKFNDSKETQDQIEFDELQKTAQNHAIAGKNFFLSGAAGTGKTLTLLSIIKLLKKNKKRVAVTACRGVAAQQFGPEATTIHSFAGYSSDYHLYEPSRSKWNDFDVVIIDEMSVLSSADFKKIEKCAKLARNNDLPMGGIQVIGSGDFYQLPPFYPHDSISLKRDCDGKIKKQGEIRRINRNYTVKYAFNTSRWDAIFPLLLNLTTVYRQKDKDFIQILDRLRTDNFLEGVYEYLAKNCSPFFNPNVPFVFISTKEVDKANNYRADKLARCIIYTDCFERTIKLAVGVPVIGLVNDDQMKDGSRGFIVGFEYDGRPFDIPSLKPEMKPPNPIFPVVKFEGYNDPTTIRMVNGEIFPITYGWAMTPDKVQGMTFESLNIDVSGCSDPGLVYFALSRVPDPSKIYLGGYEDKLVKHGRFVSLFYYAHQPIQRIPGDPE